MKNVNKLRQFPLLLLILMWLLPGPIALGAEKEAATVLVVRGEVSAGREGEKFRQIEKGALLFSGETIATGDGEAQIRFSDGGLITLYRNTRFVIDDYRYAKEDGKTNVADFSLTKGLIHALTGKIGKKNREQYKLKTSMAVLGVRGTIFLAQVTNKTADFFVLNGKIKLTNKGGDLIVKVGQGAQVKGFNQLPKLTPLTINFGQYHWGPTNRKLPQGGLPPPPPPTSPPPATPPPLIRDLEKKLKDLFPFFPW